MEVRGFLGRNREAMDGRKKSSERGLRKRVSYVQCFQGFGEAAAGSYSLMKKRLRLNHTLWRTAPPMLAGSYSLMKKRLRLRHVDGRPVRLHIAGSYSLMKKRLRLHGLEPPRREFLVAGSYSLMKKRLRLEPGNCVAAQVLYAGSYSLMKKRLRPGTGKRAKRGGLGRKLFADEEAIETDFVGKVAPSASTPEAIR